MVRKTFAAALVMLFSLALSSCNLFIPPQESTPSDADYVNTAAAQTISALSTEIAAGRTGTVTIPPLVGKSPTPTLTKTPGLATATPNPLTCSNRATFVRDVTIPDGSTLLPNSVFTKTWELKNTGTCAWNKSYSIAFANKGSAMSGAATTPLIADGEVKPGGSIVASVNLRAPNELGDYEGYWTLRAGDGTAFGTGPNGAAPFFVKIHVGQDFSFAEHLCSAEWSSGAGKLPCPGSDGDNRGFVLPLSNPTMEDNAQREGAGWLSMAQPVAGGWIVGKFPPVIVPDHSDFRATLSCAPSATGCYVRFKVTYSIDNGPEQVLGEWNEGYEGGVTEAVKDLDMAAGRSTSFFFYLYVTGDPGQGKGLWFFPRIVKN